MEFIPKALRPRLLTPSTRQALWHVLGLSLLLNVLLLASPIYMLQMYDRVLTSRSEETLYAISAITLFLLAGYGLLDILRARALVGVGLAVDAQLNDAVFTGLFREAVQRQGSASAQPVRDLEAVRALASGNALTALFDLPWAPFFIIIIFVMHPVLGSVALVGAGVSIVLSLLSDRLAKPVLDATTQHQIAAARFVDVSLRNADAITANGMLHRIRARWLESYAQSVQLGAYGADRVSAFSGGSKAFRIIMQSVMLGCGAWLILRDASISPGVMVAGSIIYGRAIAPLDQSIAASKGLLAGLAALKRLDALLTRYGQARTPMPLPKPKGTLKIEDLVLIPLGASKPVVQGIKFELAAGQVLAVIGPSASGKSSLARALVGLWPPARGSIRLDGAELSQWDADTLGSHLGYLPQDVELLAGSVRDNIARFTPMLAAPEASLAPPSDPTVNTTADAVIEAATQAGCHELVLNLPNGYDTLLGEGGCRLSGGQSQRVALARCYFGNPALVVLDEPDASLDQDGVAALDAAIARMKTRGTTAVLVTHNLRLLRHADQALMLNPQGGMAYFGPPRELMARLAGPPPQSKATPTARRPPSHRAVP